MFIAFRILENCPNTCRPKCSSAIGDPPVELISACMRGTPDAQGVYRVLIVKVEITIMTEFFISEPRSVFFTISNSYNHHRDGHGVGMDTAIFYIYHHDGGVAYS